MSPEEMGGCFPCVMGTTNAAGGDHTSAMDTSPNSLAVLSAAVAFLQALPYVPNQHS